MTGRSLPRSRAPRRRLLALAALSAALATAGCGRLFVGAEGGSASETDWTVGIEL